MTSATIPQLNDLWASLGNVPTVMASDSHVVIDEAFNGFEKGTSVEEIWLWFEEQHPAFSVGAMMIGDSGVVTATS
jgi:hypothetical protein